jgi:hypothetical protein
MTGQVDAAARLVPAVFADREAAGRAVTALQEFGIAPADIGVAVPGRERNRVREDQEGDVAAGAGRGASVGGPLGAIGGMSLMALTAGEIIALSVGGLLAVGAGGLLWGGVVGGLIGVATRVRRQPNVDRWCELELGPDAVVVVVRVRDWANEQAIAALLVDHGAREVLDKLERDHTWGDLEAVHPSGTAVPPAA